MNAAIYARKSTEQTGVAEQTRSVARQVSDARAFAEQHGWTVQEQHIFVDDGVSGAETARLLERTRMIAAATERRFEVLILQAQDRFSRRDSAEAFGELKQLAKHVEIWFYSDG